MPGRIWSAITVSRRRFEDGQILAMVAGMVAVLLGMSALAADVGAYASDRRMMQNAADAAALAGAKELPNGAAAISAAQAWGADNNVPAGALSASVIPVSASNPNPTIKVTITKNHNFFFAKAIGVGSKNVGAKATAIKTSPGGTDELVPFGVLQSTIDALSAGQTITLKYDAGPNGSQNGNFMPVRIDGPGSGGSSCAANNPNDKYCWDLMYGSNSTLCAVGVTGCVGASLISTETGNIMGPTRSGVEYRIDNTSTSCDTFNEVYTLQPDGTYSFVQQCNPFVDGSLPSLRVIMIPVIQSLCNGSCTVTVTGFAMFFITGFNPAGCQSGQACEVQGTFVRTNQSVGALAGRYDANSSMHFVRLIE